MKNFLNKLKFRRYIDKILSNVKYTILSLIGILIIGFLIGNILIFLFSKKPSDKYILGIIEKKSDVITARLNYTGVKEFKDDKGIYFINRANFIMVYQAAADIGFDLKEVDIDTNHFTKKVYVTIPEQKIINISIDTSKTKFYDEGFSLFNDDKADLNRAYDEAKKDALKNLDDLGHIKIAEEQAEILLKALIKDSLPSGYDVIVEVK